MSLDVILYVFMGLIGIVLIANIWVLIHIGREYMAICRVFREKNKNPEGRRD